MVDGADILQRGGVDDRTGARAGMAEGREASLLRSRFPGIPQPEDPLVRQLAADHLRELRDDGVTLDYIARMYGVSPERMEILLGELLPSPPR